MCGEAIKRQHDRNRHEKDSHGDQLPFVCAGQLQSGRQWGCNRRFAQEDALEKHFRRSICLGRLLDKEKEERQRVLQHLQRPAGEPSVVPPMDQQRRIGTGSGSVDGQPGRPARSPQIGAFNAYTNSPAHGRPDTHHTINISTNWDILPNSAWLRWDLLEEETSHAGMLWSLQDGQVHCILTCHVPFMPKLGISKQGISPVEVPIMVVFVGHTGENFTQNAGGFIYERPFVDPRSSSFSAQTEQLPPTIFKLDKQITATDIRMARARPYEIWSNMSENQIKEGLVAEKKNEEVQIITRQAQLQAHPENSRWQEMLQQQFLQPQLTAQDIEAARSHPSGTWADLNTDQILKRLRDQRRQQYEQILAEKRQQEELRQLQLQLQQQQQQQQFLQPQMPLQQSQLAPSVNLKHQPHDLDDQNRISMGQTKPGLAQFDPR